MATTENLNDENTHDREILKKKLSTEFPLSGGETNAEWSAAIHGTEHTPEEEAEERHEFKHKLDVDFPLSGGGDPV